jgi:hypothetical protein
MLRIGCVPRSLFRGASQAPALRVTSSAHSERGVGRSSDFDNEGTTGAGSGRL